MEEDIKILEDLIQHYERLSKNEVFTEQDRNNVIRRIQALENLLKRYKDLEEGCKTCVIRNDLNDYVENSIPISVIQNKINTYKKAIEEEDYENLRCSIVETDIAIGVLQELLDL